MLKMQRRTEKRAVKKTQWWKFEEQESRGDSAQEEEGALEKTRTNGNGRGRRRQRLHEGHFGESTDKFKANEKSSWLQEAIRETR